MGSRGEGTKHLEEFRAMRVRGVSEKIEKTGHKLATMRGRARAWGWKVALGVRTEVSVFRMCTERAESRG